MFVAVIRSCTGALAALLLAAALPSSAAQAQARHEENTDPPVLRSFYWFRYVAGSDLREACQAGATLRIRAVYNALYNDQVRTYDIERRADGTYRFAARVFADLGAIGSVTISQPADIVSPWNPHRSERSLAPGDFQRLLSALNDSAAFGPPPKGLELPSNDFWWTVASCREGRWGFQAYHFPTDHFARVRFADVLFALDGTGVAPNLPRALPPAEFRGERTRNWRLAVGANGLRDY
jgi:hypothetical protein